MTIRRAVTDAQVAALPLGSARTDLMEEIMSTPTTVPEATDSRSDRDGRPRWGVMVAAAAAIAAVIAVPVWLGSGGDGPGGPANAPASSTPSPQSVEPRPYAVLDAAGWTVTYVDGQPTDGEIQYERGDRSLDIHWRPAGTYAGYVEDRAENDPAQSVELLGEASTLWAYSPDDHTTIRPVSGDTFLEVRGSGMGQAAYVELLGSLRQVDAAGFGAALPESMVLPDELDATIASMLTEVDLPPGFDPATIDVPAFQTSYGVGALVSAAVGCAWIDAYGQAQEDGDAVGQAAAAAAMRGSRQWSWLTAMRAEGEWNPAVDSVVRGMTAGKPASVLRGQLGC